MYRKWDIIWVNMPFREDSNQTKMRPCLIIDIDYETEEYIIIGITTSSPMRDTDYVVKYYKQANLKANNVIMTDYIVKVSISGKYGYVGHLDKSDKISIMRIMSE